MIYYIPEGCFNYLKSPPGLYSIRNLRSIVFNTVDVCGEIVEFFVYNCPHLEQLRVSKSVSLVILTVVSSSIRLKHLEIHRCYMIKKVEIAVSSLLSFKYHGRAADLNVVNVPLLVDVSLGGSYSTFIGPNRSYLPHLETLELELLLYNETAKQSFPCESPKLRHLTLNVTAYGRQNLVGLTCMISACPFLQKLTLKLNQIYPKTREMHQFPKGSHQYLKVVELFGFGGYTIEVEFAAYLFESATMLEKVVVQPLLEDQESQSAARERTKTILEKMLPDRVELVIY